MNVVLICEFIIYSVCGKHDKLPVPSVMHNNEELQSRGLINLSPKQWIISLENIFPYLTYLVIYSTLSTFVSE